MDPKSMEKAMLNNMIEKTGKPINEWISIVNEQNFVENKKTLGLITSEDIFEEIFGEFEDEFDNKPVDVKVNSDGSILVNAKMKWIEFNKEFGDLIPKGDYETIAGYIISDLGRIPNAGEHLFMNLGQVVIKKASDRYIEKILIYPKKKNS